MLPHPPIPSCANPCSLSFHWFWVLLLTSDTFCALCLMVWDSCVIGLQTGRSNRLSLNVVSVFVCHGKRNAPQRSRCSHHLTFWGSMMIMTPCHFFGRLVRSQTKRCNSGSHPGWNHTVSIENLSAALHQHAGGFIDCGPGFDYVMVDWACRMLSCPLKNNGINRQQPFSNAMQHTLDNLSSKAHAANIVFLFSIIQPSSLCPLPSGTMTSWDIITNQHELPVLCAVQITKKVFHNTPCFFPPGPFIFYIGFSKVVCGIGRAEWYLPRPMEGPPHPFPMGPGFLFFSTDSDGYNGILVPGEYAQWGDQLCGNWCLLNTMCAAHLCFPEGGGRGHTCWKTSIHTGPKECTSHGSLLDL